MPTIDLDANDAAILRDTLENVLSDLGYEIANTDAKAFRDKLKERRTLLKRVVDELGGS